MIALAGCVQPAMYPNINGAAARVLDRLGITLIEPENQGCCGAVRHHLCATEAARAQARRNIDVWWPWLERGAEAVVMTASGCGAHVREYAYLLQHDKNYATKAARVTLLSRDISEIVAAELAAPDHGGCNPDALEPGKLAPDAHRPAHPASVLRAMLTGQRSGQTIAIHNPCSLQHGQQLRGLIETLISATGATLAPVADAHLCCGSAGTYSLLQPELAQQLKANKLAALCAAEPDMIVSANVGCIAHLGAGAPVPVRHWIELIDELSHST